jgi:hypothetical protein
MRIFRHADGGGLAAKEKALTTSFFPETDVALRAHKDTCRL